MLVRTSQRGRVYVVSLPNAKVLQAYLVDFDIDGDNLKDAHKEWLDRHIIERIALVDSAGRTRLPLPGERAHATWFIWLIGHASRTGSDAHNLDLSARRISSVETYIYARLNARSPVSKVKHLRWPRGETKAKSAQPDETEDLFYRSVQILFLPLPVPDDQPEPIRPDPIPPPRKPKWETVEYRIRLVSGGGVSGVIGAEAYMFEILDVENNNIGLYAYAAPIAGMSLPVPKVKVPNVTPSWSFRGPWNSFRQPRVLGAGGFQGPAKYYSASAIKWSWNRFEFGGPVSLAYDRSMTKRKEHPLERELDRLGYKVYRVRIEPFQTGYTAAIPSITVPVPIPLIEASRMWLLDQYTYTGI